MNTFLLAGALSACQVADAPDSTRRRSSLPPEFQKSLGVVHSCGDIDLALSRPDDRLALFFRNWDAHFVGTAIACDAPRSSLIELPDLKSLLWVASGENLTACSCDPSCEIEREIDQAWVAVSGELRIDVEPALRLAGVRLELSDLVLEPAEADHPTIELAELVVDDLVYEAPPFERAGACD